MNISFFEPVRIQEEEKIKIKLGRQADCFFNFKNRPLSKLPTAAPNCGFLR